MTMDRFGWSNVFLGMRRTRILAAAAFLTALLFSPESRSEDRAQSALPTFARWKDTYWRVQVAPARGGAFRIHYTGWDESWDETVACDRLFFSRATEGMVTVEWRGAYYRANVLGQTPQGLRIHYVGYDSSWDEVVPEERIARLVSACPATPRAQS